MSAIDPNSALAGDLFSQADMSTGFVTDVVTEGEYTLALSARYNKKDGGIIFVEGKIQAGTDAGKNVKVFSAVLDSNTSKRANQKGIALTNLDAIGISTEVLNQTAKQVGAVAGNLEPLYQAVTAMIEGRIINAQLVPNTYKGRQGEVTEMQLAIGKATLVQAPAVAIGGAPVIPVATAPAAAPEVAAPAPAVVAAPPLPAVAVAAPPAVAPVAVAPAPALVEVPAVAPVAVAPAPVAVAPAPALVAVAPAPAPVEAAPVAVAPAPAPVAPAPAVGTVVVAPEPSF